MTGDEVVLEMEPELMNVIWVELGGLDLICIPKDCCDGNDEYDGKVKCPNTCWEAGKVARDKLKKKIWRCTGRTGGQWSNRGRIFEKLFGIQA